MSKLASIALGIDFEVIEKDKRFFGILASKWPGRVHVFIYHDNKVEVENRLHDLAIWYESIISIHNHDELLTAIADNEIAYYYQGDDAIIELPLSLTVFKMHSVWEVTDDQSVFLLPGGDPN